MNLGTAIAYIDLDASNFNIGLKNVSSLIRT